MSFLLSVAAFVHRTLMLLSVSLTFFGEPFRSLCERRGLCLFLIPLERLFSKENRGLEFAWSSLVYVAVPFAPLNVVGFFGYNGWKIASLLILLWAGDVGAYCIGTAFGQGPRGHKLMPSVSPKKSWEGVIGSLIFSVIAAVFLRYFNLLLPEASYKACTLYALIVSIFAVMGDLVESQLKRRFEVKDSGNIMPATEDFWIDLTAHSLPSQPQRSSISFIIT